jgi:hypothetical protein
MREMNPRHESYQPPNKTNKLSLRQIINKIKKMFTGDKVEIQVNFHYASGFITLNDSKHNGKVIYVNTGDERYENNIIEHVLFRTAKHTKDYTGGSNHHFDLNKTDKQIIVDRIIEGEIRRYLV